MTPWQLHRDKWKKCTACGLCKTRRNVVLVDGDLPCDVLFIGEAPGITEDRLGKPFSGPAGHDLHAYIEQAWGCDPAHSGYSRAFTNIIACVPLDESGSKNHEPPQESIKACAPRVQELIAIAKPRLVVYVGEYAEKWVGKLIKLSPSTQTLSITHPAAIMRANTAAKPFLIQRCVVALRDALASL